VTSDKFRGCSRLYLGVDIAGAGNTWACALQNTGATLLVQEPPCSKKLDQIVTYCDEKLVLAAAIDAQLTWAPIEVEDAGFRTSDVSLRDMLPNKKWVQSQNSLMAVTVRGRQLAECLAPRVGTLIETHPRACLYFFAEANDKSLVESVNLYKYKPKKGDSQEDKKRAKEEANRLWNRWTQRFNIKQPKNACDVNDGALDALVCATIAYLFHESPEYLCLLVHEARDKRGQGPFMVLRPVEGCLKSSPES